MQKKIDDTAIVQKNPEIITAKADDEVVMMSMENNEYYGLNAVAARIWDLIENPVKVCEIIEQLLNEFEVDEVTCRNEVFEFLNSLDKKKIIKVL